VSTIGAYASRCSLDALRADSDPRAYRPCHRLAGRDGTASTPELGPGGGRHRRRASPLSVRTSTGQPEQPGDGPRRRRRCGLRNSDGSAVGRLEQLDELDQSYSVTLSGLNDHTAFREWAGASVRRTGLGAACVSRSGMCRECLLTNSCPFITRGQGTGNRLGGSGGTSRFIANIQDPSVPRPNVPAPGEPTQTRNPFTLLN
jgi:hypothetical protein